MAHSRAAVVVISWVDLGTPVHLIGADFQDVGFLTLALVTNPIHEATHIYQENYLSCRMATKNMYKGAD